jgi:hypothetical protein
MPMWFTDGHGRALPPDPLRPGESADVRPVGVQMEDASLRAFVEAFELRGVGEMKVRDWLLTRQDHVREALERASRAAQTQRRRCGLL